MIALIREYTLSTPFEAKLTLKWNKLIVATCSVRIKNIHTLSIGTNFRKFEAMIFLLFANS